MDVRRILVAILRRWFVFLPLVALTVFGAQRVGEGVRPQFEVTATAILLPATARSDVTNPYGVLDETNQVLEIVINSPTARDSIEAQGLEPRYELDPRTRSQIMDLTVLSDSPDVALSTAESVLERVRQELAERQHGVGLPENAQVSLQVLQEPAVSEVVQTGQSRSITAVVIVGVMIATTATVLVDYLIALGKGRLLSWRHRRGAQRMVGT